MTDVHSEPRPLPRELRDADPPTDNHTLDDLFEAVASQTLDCEPTVRDRARELPTPTRIGVATGITLVLAAIYLAVTGVRADLDAGGWLRFLLSSGVLVSVGIGAAALTLRSLHARPLHATASRIALLAVALPIVASIVPGIMPGVLHPDGVPLAAHVGCGLGGLLAGLTSSIIVLFFAREDTPTGGQLLAAAGAGGLFGYAVQAGHCPAVDLDHLLIAHAGYGVAIWGLLTIVLWSRRTA